MSLPRRITPQPVRLEDLPAEVMNNIISHLVGSTHTGAPTARETSSDSTPWPFQIQNQPSFHTDILRTNKALHIIAKSYLDVPMQNKWVLFDMDHVFLLLPWIRALVPFALVDPAAGQKIPEGVIRVRVQLFLNDSAVTRMMQEWFPASMPHRQFVLVQLEYFEAFLQCLRVVELVHGVRIMSGKWFQMGGQEKLANPGFLGMNNTGLNIHITVNNPQCPEKREKALLDSFRIFHGPCNVVVISGATDASHAQTIESSITTPRDAATPTNHEILLHMAKLTQFATECASNGRCVSASAIYDQLSALPIHSFKFDRTPWNGSINFNDETTWSQRPFDIFMLTSLNNRLGDIRSETLNQYPTSDDVIEQSPLRPVLFLEQIFGVTREMSAWINLITGLHCIFTMRVGNSAPNSPERLAVVVYGLGCINGIVGNFEHLPEDETVLFRKTIEVCKRFRFLLQGGNTTLLFKAIATQAKKFAVVVRQHRAIRWAVNESRIPSELVARGILAHMTDCRLMTEAEDAKVMLVDVFATSVSRERFFYL